MGRGGILFLIGGLSLLLVAGLLLSLSDHRALAQPVAAPATLVVEKTVNAEVAAPTDILTYTITIRDAEAPEGTVWLTDSLPAELVCITDSLVSTFYGSSSYGVRDNVITWTADMYGNNQTAILQFSAQISTAQTYVEVQNTAQVTAAGELREVTSPKTVVAMMMGNLDNSLTQKTVSREQAQPGEVVTFTIRLNNSEEYFVPDVRVVDRLPAGLRIRPASVQYQEGSHVVHDNVLTWTIDMDGYWAMDLSFSADVLPHDGRVTNTIEIITPTSSFTRAVGLDVQRLYPHLAATKTVQTAHTGYARPGERLTYTVRIVNSGEGDAYPVWMTDTLGHWPFTVYLVPDSLTATMGTFGVAGDVVTWNLTTEPGGTLLLPRLGGSAVLTYEAEVWPMLQDNIVITNTAQITGGGALITASSTAQVMYRFSLYLPLVFRNYPPIVTLNPIPAPVNHAYDVSWQPLDADLDHYVLQQSRTADFATVAQSWETEQTMQTVTDIYCSYYYRVRADKASGWGVGPWSDVQQGAISAPDAPVLNSISDSDGDGSYTVSWSALDLPAGGVAVDRYVLQESLSSDFASISRQWVTTDASYTVPGSSNPGAAHYYRVRADDDDCWGQGPWSNVQYIYTIYYDSFNTSGTGWPNDRGPIVDLKGDVHGYWHRQYKSGHYRLYVEQPDCWTCGWFYQPNALAPYRPSTDKYCIETDVKFEDGAYWASMGVIFGADEANEKIYAMCLSRGSDEDQLGWFLMRKDNYEFPKRGCAGPTYKIEGEDASDAPGTSRYGWNRIRIGVDGNQVTLYIGGYYKGRWTMNGLSNMTRLGVIGGVYEILPVDIRYSYYRVIPGSDCTS